MSTTSQVKARVSSQIDTNAVTDAAAKAARPLLTSTVLKPSTAGPINPPALPLLHRLLARYLTSLATKPLKTKSYTSAVLFFLQEVIATRASGSPKEEWPAKNSILRKFVPPQLLDLLRGLGVSSKALQVRTSEKTRILNVIEILVLTIALSRLLLLVDGRIRSVPLRSYQSLLRRFLPEDVRWQNWSCCSARSDLGHDVDPGKEIERVSSPLARVTDWVSSNPVSV